MKNVLSRYAAYCFTICCLGLGLAALPAHQALAGQTVNINGIHGGDAYGNSDDGGFTDNLPPNNNILNINNGGTVTGSAYGGLGGPATGNTVNVNSGGSVSNTVYGGYGGNAAVNTVNISGTGSVVGWVHGGFALSGNATGNTVSISGGSVGRDVYGGFSNSGNATGNTVNISGTGSVGGHVLGGHVYGGYVAGGTGAATGNTVTISGAPTFGAATILYGGGTNVGTGDLFTGNTLNVWNYKGSAVNGVENFQFLNFAFPTTQSGPVLKVTTEAILGDGVVGKSSTITAGTIGGKDPLKPGSSVTLIDASAGVLDDTDFTQTKAKGMHGATLAYQWTLDTAGDMLTATVDKVQASPQAKALSEGFIMGLPLVNETTDFLVGKGIPWARTASGNGFG
ncbi:MAG: hypothetical protein FWG74_07525, partial [Planctomycetes bacterium]|nr:hypothetical protein [Planctomycetota bacterium]